MRAARGEVRKPALGPPSLRPAVSVEYVGVEPATVKLGVHAAADRALAGPERPASQSTCGT